MTREEAIARIKNHKIVHKMNEPRAMYISEALDMAIKALDQMPCDDAISRRATVQRLCKIADFMNEKRDGLGSPYVMAALFIQDNKDEFPCVTPQKSKTGHWIKTNNYFPGDYENIDYVKCSCCNVDSLEEGDYCPNCGAEMTCSTFYKK